MGDAPGFFRRRYLGPPSSTRLVEATGGRRAATAADRPVGCALPLPLLVNWNGVSMILIFLRRPPGDPATPEFLRPSAARVSSSHPSLSGPPIGDH